MNNMATLSEVIERFIFAKQAERYSHWTIEDYSKTYKKFIDFVDPNTPFKFIDALTVWQFLADQDQVADKTLCNYHTALSSLYTWAVEHDYADTHVLNKVKRPTFVVPEMVPYTQAEVTKILRSCRYTRDRAIVLVLLDTGMRASELCALQLDDWVDQTLQIRCGKGKKSRIVPISDKTDQLILKQLKKRRIGVNGLAGGDGLFASNISGNPLCYTSLASLMERLGKYSGVQGVHCHRFRHTFAITFLRNGGNIFTLKKILGHSTLMMVQRYLAIAQSDVVEAHAVASPVTVWGLG